MMTTEKHLVVNGVELFYTRTGAGDSIILLHAGVSSHAMWNSYIGGLAQNHCVYALDMRGHGRSEYDDRGISYPLLADDLAEFIHLLNLDRPHVIGYSSGGNVALDFAVRYPAVAATVTIGAAWLHASPSLRAAVRQIGILGPGIVDFDTVCSALGHLVDKWRDEHSPRYGAEHWMRLFEYMAEMGLTPHANHGATLQKIVCPALVFAADRDGIIPLDQTIEQFEQIPNAELLIIPGTNHMTVLGKVEFLSQAILEYISRHSMTRS